MGSKTENADFVAAPFKGFGLNPTFLLDIQLRYLYILPNQKRIFELIITRHGFCREIILACFIVL